MTTFVGVQRRDWQDRDFIEVIARNIKRISDFLNNFDQSCRGKLAELNAKITNLERQMDYLEASIDGANEQAAMANSLQQQAGEIHLQQANGNTCM